MIDSDQHPDSNQHWLFKSASTHIIITNNGQIKGYSQLSVLSQIYCRFIG